VKTIKRPKIDGILIIML